MDEQQTPDEGAPDDSDTTVDEQPESRPVTVPNVTPGAKSGLAHEVIGSAAQDAYDATNDGEGDEQLEVPAGDLESRLAWAAEPEDVDERHDRADAIYAHEEAAGDTDLDELRSRLTLAVYGEASATVPATQVIPGEEAQTDGPVGDAENAETGEVTPAGEPLPPGPDDGTGNALSEPSSGEPAPEAGDTAIDSPAAEDAAQGPESGGASSGDEAAKGA